MNNIGKIFEVPSLEGIIRGQLDQTVEAFKKAVDCQLQVTRDQFKAISASPQPWPGIMEAIKSALSVPPIDAKALAGPFDFHIQKPLARKRRNL